MASATCIDDAFRRHGAEALATLIRLVGDFDLAEEGLQEAFAAAAVAWAKATPDNPRAWLITVGRRRALDQLRRKIAFRSRQEQLTVEARSNARRRRPRSMRPRRRSATTTCCG
jgi:RNA polymerase sigma-70 factor (ECF subfamily)